MKRASFCYQIRFVDNSADKTMGPTQGRSQMLGKVGEGGSRKI